MAKGILGKKIGMTQIFDKEGKVIPVTVIEAGPCVVVQKKTAENDGYAAIQLGYDDQREKLINKPLKGHFAKAGVKVKRFVRELREVDANSYEVGQEIKVDAFAEGDLVDVVGTSRGKGFAGVIKKYNFSRGPMGHGSMYHRRVGSLGATDAARVFRGRKMPGRMGGERVTVQKLTVAKIYPDRNLMLIKGAVPGAKGSYVIVSDSTKA